MAKTKLNLEKKAKAMPEFDKVTPEQRVKSIKAGKISKKKPKVKKEVIKSNSAEIEKEVKEKVSKEVTQATDKLVKREVVKTAINNLRNAIKKEIEDNTSTAKNLFDDELRYGLNVVAIKVPVCPPHTRKILLTHSLYDDKPDVCFIICDAIPKKGDQDATVRVFKEKLDAAGITSVTHVMTLGQLKRDYSTHNMKHKLCNTYDVFLVESKIAEHVYSILGKNFITKRKRPFQVDASNEKAMKISIDNALKKSTLKISPKSHLSAFEVGTAKMDNAHIADNIMTAIEQLKEKWPGSWKNISRLYLKPMQPSKISIPIYLSGVNPNEVEVPVITGAKQNRLDKLQAKLKKKSEKISVDVKSKKIARNRPVKKDDDTKEAGQKRKHEDDDLEKPKKKKEKAPKVVEETVEQPVEKKKKKERDVTEDEKVSKKDKKKTQSDEKLQAVTAADVLEKKKKKKSQETPTEPESEPQPEKKKKKKEKLEVTETAAESLKPEKKKKKQKSEPEEIPQDPPKAKNKKQKTGDADTEKEQTNVKKMKTKKNKA